MKNSKVIKSIKYYGNQLPPPLNTPSAIKQTSKKLFF